MAKHFPWYAQRKDNIKLDTVYISCNRIKRVSYFGLKFQCHRKGSAHNMVRTSWEELLVKHRDLPFDQEVARRICLENTFVAPLEAFSTLTHESKLWDFLRLFRDEGCAEEFLCRYIAEKLGTNGWA